MSMEIAASTRESDHAIGNLSKPHGRGKLRSLAAVRAYLKADLHRYPDGKAKFWRHFLFTPGFKYTVWMRLAGWATSSPLKKLTIGLPIKIMLNRCRIKYGIAIPEYTVIGPGLFINRFGGIYVNGDAEIGPNCNIAQMTVIGQVNRGPRAGSPIIGEGCSIAAGACLVGRIHIGPHSIVGNNAVVTKDMPPNAVIGGVPAKLLSSAGSDGYVNRAIGPDMLARCLYLAGRR